MIPYGLLLAILTLSREEWHVHIARPMETFWLVAATQLTAERMGPHEFRVEK